MINYIVPFGLCMVSFVWIDKFQETGKNIFLCLVSLVYIYLSGAGYTPIVLAFEVLALRIFAEMIKNKRQNCNLPKRIFKLLIPLTLLIIGFTFSAISPGNAVRGGENYYFSVGRIITTILECIKCGLYGGIEWVFSVRPLFLIIPILVLGIWEQVDIAKSKLKFNHPVFVTVLLFLISSSMYAPGIYAQSEVSGGVPDTIYFVFLVSSVLGIIYLTCCIKKSVLERQFSRITEKQLEKLRVIIIVGEIIFCLVFGRYLIGNMADYICFEYIRSGQLSDFDYQMKERLEVLNNPEITDVVLPEMNNEQGPFMHMPLMAAPDAYTNRATARFYGKESVIAIPRTEYYELYGYPEK